MSILLNNIDYFVNFADSLPYIERPIPKNEAIHVASKNPNNR